MKQKAFRLSDYHIGLLHNYAVEHDMSETDVIRASIDRLADSDTSCDTPAQGAGNDELVQELRREIAKKDALIDTLMRQNEKYLDGLVSAAQAAQDTARAAQVLQATEKGLGPTKGHKKPLKRLLSRFRRDSEPSQR